MFKIIIRDNDNVIHIYYYIVYHYKIVLFYNTI